MHAATTDPAKHNVANAAINPAEGMKTSQTMSVKPRTRKATAR